MVAVLFARRDSNYKAIPGLDVWDADRDARKFEGGAPVVAHPPCRLWGRLRKFAKGVPGEKELAFFAVRAVRANGGVLEHPEASTLWSAAGLPKPGQGCDEWGGWTLPISQFWWGHRAEKKTWLYICGCDRWNLPLMPLALGDAPCVVARSRGVTKGGIRRPELSKAEREHTPAELCAWLVELAEKCRCGGSREAA